MKVPQSQKSSRKWCYQYNVRCHWHNTGNGYSEYAAVRYKCITTVGCIFYEHVGLMHYSETINLNWWGYNTYWRWSLLFLENSSINYLISSSALVKIQIFSTQSIKLTEEANIHFVYTLCITEEANIQFVYTLCIKDFWGRAVHFSLSELASSWSSFMLNFNNMKWTRCTKRRFSTVCSLIAKKKIFTDQTSPHIWHIHQYQTITLTIPCWVCWYSVATVWTQNVGPDLDPNRSTRW